MKHRIFILLLSMLLISSCVEQPGELEFKVSDIPPGNNFANGNLNLTGKELYEINCMSCHYDVGRSTKISRTAQQIENAILSNSTMKSKQFLKDLTSDQISLIAQALLPQALPEVDPMVGITNAEPLDRKYLIKTLPLLASKFKSIFVNEAMASSDVTINNIITRNIINHKDGLFGGLCVNTGTNCPYFEGDGEMLPTTSPGRSGIINKTCSEILSANQSVQNALAQVGLTVNSIPSVENMNKLFDLFFPGAEPDLATIDSLIFVQKKSIAESLSPEASWRMVMSPMCKSSLFEVF